MHDSVTFDLCHDDGKIAFKDFHGYVHGDLPVDKVAQVVLSSTEHPIESVRVGYGDGQSAVYHVRKILHDNLDYATAAQYVAAMTVENMYGPIDLEALRLALSVTLHKEKHLEQA